MKEVFTCDFCETVYSTKELRDACVAKHNIIYIGLPRKNLKEPLQAFKACRAEMVYLDPDTYEALNSL